MIEIVIGLVGFGVGWGSRWLRRRFRLWRDRRLPLALVSGCHDLVVKPWGQEEIWARTPEYVGKILTIRAGESLSLQYHRVKDETILVLEGRLTLLVERGGEQALVVLHPRDTYRIVPGTIHRMVAGEETVKLVEVSTPELQDVVRLSDKYGRVV